MTTDELRVAHEVLGAIESGEAYALWAPGDATVYRVTLLRVVQSSALTALNPAADLEALVVIAGLGGPGPALVVERPRVDDGWNPVKFYSAYGARFAGWWAGVRPLLAVLGWTTDEHSSRTYDPSDAVKIGEVTNQVSER